MGPDDVAVTVEGRDGFMDEFFAEVCVNESYFFSLSVLHFTYLSLAVTCIKRAQ